MKLFKLFKTFNDDESGAVTVDWVVLTAAIVGLGLAVVATVSKSIGTLGTNIATSVSGTKSGRRRPSKNSTLQDTEPRRRDAAPSTAPLGESRCTRPSFLRAEDGAVTVDWVVLTAAIVGLGIGVVASVYTGAGNATDRVAASVATTKVGP